MWLACSAFIDLTRRFEMSKPRGYVDTGYLEMAARVVASYKERTYALMLVETGHRVLDVGCGPGTDTIPLAQLVGVSGRVVGVDFDEAMVAEADERAQEAGVRAWTTHRSADATSLPFEDGYFDSVRSERLFQHLTAPARALSEMTRVTRRDGWVVVLDTDWMTLSFDTGEIDIEQRLKDYKIAETLYNATAGRQLRRLFIQQGLEDLSVEVLPISGTDYGLGRQGALLDEVEQGALAAGLVTSDELERWRSSLEQADAQGVYFGTVNQVLVAGRKA
jgi:ubiquinone/menaquinone biosynthesis C-methylase UbiE